MKKIFTFSLLLFFLSWGNINEASAQQGISLNIEKSCFEGVVEFEVKNFGADIRPGDSISYIVIEDEIIARQGLIDSLDSGEKMLISLTAQASEYRLDLYQGSTSGTPMQQSSIVCSASQMRMVMKRWSLGLQAGTLGPGISIEKQFNNSLSLRLGGTYLPYSFDYPSPYDFSDLVVNTQVTTAGLMLDWFIAGDTDALFHFTAGGIYNLSELNFVISPSAEWVSQAGNFTTAEEIGYLDITATPQKINPYFGIGIGRLGSAVKKIGGKFELGAYYFGSPEIQMKATGAVEPTASQEDLIQSNVSTYRWYPNINFIISIKL